MTSESTSLRPQEKFDLSTNHGKGMSEDNNRCADVSMKTEEETSASTESPELHPVDDEMIANEDEPEVGAAVPPPPAMPEDIDGNWARPVRQRVRALPNP